VNCVRPGYIDTPISGDCPFEMKEVWNGLTPMKSDADPRELKGVYLYLAHDASTYTPGADSWWMAVIPVYSAKEI
jgi:sorbose reductase